MAFEISPGRGLSNAGWLLLCGGTAAMCLGGVVIGLRPATRAPPAALTVIYVGADDCAPCRAWQKDDKANFRNSSEFAQIGYREIKSPRLHELLNDEYWPPDLRHYRAQLTQRDGVPLWLIISGKEIVGRASGLSAWDDRIVPDLRSRMR